ncbi:MAG: MTAP family purine nucleoside phosphorylase [Deltaproteobacteria bacterium]
MVEIPQCDLAFIGGSSTLNLNIPEELNLDYVKLETSNLVFDTPFGKSPEFLVLLVENKGETRRVLSCRMHGWRKGNTRADASRQVFWVLQQAGVKQIIAEGGVGAINHLLRPRDLVIVNDYMDFSMRQDVGIGDRYLMVMRDSLCPQMRAELSRIAEKNWPGRVFDRGIYVNTDGRHFESPAEINFYKLGGGDVVGQSICPEVYLAREIGACYTGLYMVVNYAEGIVKPWEHEELAEIFYTEGINICRIIFSFLRDITLERDCSCSELRKDTLLRKVYE